MLRNKGFKIEEIQISAAFKARLPETIEQRKWVMETLASFVESTYLHQVVERNSQGTAYSLSRFTQGIENLNNPAAKEWRTHFHVPIFLDSYGQLESTQEDILEVLEYLRKEKVFSKGSVTEDLFNENLEVPLWVAK